MTAPSAADLQFEQVTPGAALQHALVRGDPRLARFAGWTVSDPEFLATATREAGARTLDRERLVDAIQRRLAALDAPAESTVAAERLRVSGSVVVIAGQQPGLLAGAHLVVSKALMAIVVARKIERVHGVPAIPVFWSASEDHDHGEADHVVVQDAAGALERVRLELPEDRLMLGELVVPGGADELVEAVVAGLPDGPGRAWIAELLPSRAGETMADWSARILLGLLGRFGLVLVDPRDLREFAQPVLRREIQQPGDLHARLEAVLREIRVEGFDAPLELARPELFFFVRDGRRYAPTHRAGVWELGDGTSLTSDELLVLLERDPAAFSWNVAARVLAQNVALPVAAQICGPSELGYAAALAPLHAALGVPAPHLVARPGVTWVDPRVVRALSSLGVEAASVVARGDAPLELPSGAYPPELEELESLVARLPEAPTPAAKKRRTGLERAATLYTDAIRVAITERDEAAVRRRAIVLENLRPSGRLQERTLSALPWFARYGPQFADAWLELLSAPHAEHVVAQAAQAVRED